MEKEHDIFTNGRLTYSRSVYDKLKDNFGIDLSVKEFADCFYVGVEMKDNVYYLTTKTDAGEMTKEIKLFEKYSDYICKQ